MAQKTKVSTTMASAAKVICARIKWPSMVFISSTVDATIERFLVLHGTHNGFGKLAAILEEEHGQNRHQQQPPRILDASCRAEDEVLDGRDDLIAMLADKFLDSFRCGFAPAVLQRELVHKLAVANPVHQLRRLMPELVGFIHHSWPHGNKQDCECSYKDHVNGGNRGATRAAKPFFQSRNRSFEQIGKENGEQEGNNRAPGRVEEKQDQHEHQRCEQRLRSPFVEKLNHTGKQ